MSVPIGRLLRLAVVGVLIGCLAAAVVTSAGATSKKKQVRIAVLLSSAANTYEQANLAGVRAAAKQFGGKVVKVFDANFQASTQESQAQDAVVSKQFDAFVIVPQSGSALVPQVKAAVKAGIKVACALSSCTPNQQSDARQIPGYVTTVGYQFSYNGTQIGEAIAAACKKLNPCNVAYEPGLLTFSTETYRTNAVKAYLKKFKNIKLVAVQQGQYLANTGRTAMENILQAHPNVNVAASSGDQMTLGMEQAVKGAGLTGKVALIGNGASVPGVQAVRQGRWYATVANVPYTEGYLAGKYVIMAAQGTPISKIPPFVNDLAPAILKKYTGVGTAILTKAQALKFKAQWAG